jgi:hypothetical protein
MVTIFVVFAFVRVLVVVELLHRREKVGWLAEGRTQEKKIGSADLDVFETSFKGVLAVRVQTQASFCLISVTTIT